MEAWAVVVAGGGGSRFGRPKQFEQLAGRTLVDRSLDVAREACSGVVLVLPAERVSDPGEWDVDALVAGGPTRSASVRAGIDAVPGSASVIAVHDAARPLARVELWKAVIDAVAEGADAAIPAAAVTDTVKEVGEDGHLVTLDRSRLVAVQTPQAFRADILRLVHGRGGEATDDAALVEEAGGRVQLVPGPRDNIKITCPEDLLVASALLEGLR